jgi:hypothetical protein
MNKYMGNKLHLNNKQSLPMNLIIFILPSLFTIHIYML